MWIKLLVLGGTCLGTSILMPALAAAQSNSDLAKIDRLQRQMEQLQEQIKSLKSEMAQTKKKASDTEAAVQGAYAADVATKAPLKAPSVVDRVKLTWGGFLAAETVYRQRNEVADIGSNFGAIPYPFSPLFNESEFHGSARQSRISLLVEGALDPAQKLAGYYEMDFLGVGATSNFNQSNSWAPRLRQAFFSYDNSDWGFHFVGGQAWSLLTQNTSGIMARKENIPLTIDASYVPGFDYTRNWQLRLVKDFAPWFSAGVSVEGPAQQVFTGTGAIGNNGTVNGLIVNFNNPGGSFLGSSGFANTFTTDTAPDVIEKAAFDPGWGHYEVFGVQRFFTDNVFTCSVVVAGVCPINTANTGSASSKTTFGAGIGGSILLPLIPSYLDLTAEALYGRGIGRYGAGQLSDVFVGPDGSLTPVTGFTAMGGLVGHPWAGLDVYAYAGIEQAQSNFFLSGAGVITGFGVPTAVNTGCNITTAASFTGGASNCAAINKTLSGVTVGFWQDLYKGNYGLVRGGLQYEFIRRESFDGVGGTVSTDDNIFLTSLRYYPF
ncbi:MAG TPA: FlxA-like family protein [Xanthobacteraceae bacterium]|nr:FlxA-like family protein [Xanthobacteraceae bacterium]